VVEDDAEVRIAVIGAGGVLGGFLARSLREQGHSVLRVVRRPDGDTQTRSIDLRDREQLLELASACDIVVSTVREPDLTPERTVLAGGGTLMSLASLTLKDRRELVAYAEDNKQGAVVVHAGMNPGVSSVILKELLRREPQADAAEIVLTLSAKGSGGRHGMVTAGIPMMKSRRRHATGIVELPAPFGRRRCIAVGNGSEGFFGEVGSGIERRLYWCFYEDATQRMLLALNRLGAMRVLPDRLLVAGHRKVPQALSQEPKRDLVAVTLGGRTLRAVSLKGDGDYAMTVTASVAMVELLLDAGRTGALARGCWGAEEVFGYEPLLAALNARGIVVHECAP